MSLNWLKFKSKQIFPSEGIVYRLLRDLFYEYKSIVDFLLFKMKYPSTEWYRFYGRRHFGNSQFGQDQYLLKLAGDKKLNYLEIGANHPIRLNNTLLLEESGWSGISIDPLKKYEQLWESARKNRFICMAVGKEKCEKEFIEFSGGEDWIDMMSGFAEYVRNEDYVTFNFRSYTVNTDRLDMIVGDYKFDVLLLDTEGAELEILKGIDLSIHSPTYLVIENAKKIGGANDLRAVLHSNGYRVVARLGCSDDIFKRVD